MEEMRALVSYGLAHRKPRILQADVTGACVKAPISGSPTFICLKVFLWPQTWKGMADPVVLLHTAIYGLEQADSDWSNFRDKPTTHW